MMQLRPAALQKYACLNNTTVFSFMSEATEPRVAIISGGAGYIGGAIAEKLSKDGFKIALLYHRTIANFVSLSHDGHRMYQCDLGREEAVVETIKKIVADFNGIIDVCVHAAESKIYRSSIRDLSGTEFRKHFDVGVFGGFNLFNTVAHHMKRGGVMIGITTVYTKPRTYASKIGAYIPAKCALNGLLRVLSKELAPGNIRVHAVAPGFLPAGMNSDLPSAVAKFIYEKNSGKKHTTIKDVVEKVSYLCSPLAAHLTGFSFFISSDEQIPL